MDVEKRLLREAGRAIADHGLIEGGDKIMVALSGGKDSYGLLQILRILQKRAPVRFELVAVHVDQGQPGYDGRPLEAWLAAEGYAHEIVRENTYDVVVSKIDEGKTYCSLCSRLRRGILYSAAKRLGCNKLALGHHRDDALETLLLNLFFGGKLAAMPATLRNDEDTVTVIRPLIYCAEGWLADYAAEQGFAILPCKLCGSQDGAQRKQMKALLTNLEAAHPSLRQNMLAALGNVRPSQLLDPNISRRVAPVTAARAALPILGDAADEIAH